MQQLPKAIFCDIDWTIFDHSSNNHVLDMESIETLNKMHDLGVKVFLCTARAYPSTKQIGILDALRYDGLIFCSGGLVIIDDKIIYRNEITREKYLKIVDLCLKNDVNLEVVEPYRCTLIKPIDQKVKDYYAIYVEPIPEYDDYISKHPVALLMFASLEDDEKIIPNLPEGIMYYRFFPTGVDIMEKQNSKGEAVDIILDYLKIDKKDAIAFGDDDQDIEMFKSCGVSFAMGNAKEAVKANATYIIPEVYNHGVKVALEEHYLNKK